MSKLSSCRQIIFSPQENYCEKLTSFLEEYFEVVTFDYQDDGLECCICYSGEYFNEKEFKTSAQNLKIDLPNYTVKLMESENWLKDYVIEFPSFETEDFLIYGIHEKNQPKTSKTLLQIYAATAFGSNHSTTQMCIKALSELTITPNKILDVGCGSGILSLVAGKYWPKAEILSVDIDEESVIVTEQNSTNNNIKLNAKHSNGYEKVTGKFDLILANILARPLIEMANDLGRHLNKGGFCILSGFNDEQVDWVVDSHKQQGLELRKIYKQDSWRAVLMEKSK